MYREKTVSNHTRVIEVSIEKMIHNGQIDLYGKRRNGTIQL